MREIPSSTRPTWAEVDLGALAANYRELTRRLGPEIEIIASVKANAYGHGIVPVARTLAAEGTFALATGSFDDAVAVREAGVSTRIVLFGGPLPDAMPELLRHDLTPTVFDRETAEAVSSAARKPTAVWVKVDSGFGRLGIAVEEAESFVKTVAALPHVVVEGLYTHLPFVDPEGREWAARSVGPFRELAGSLARSGLSIPFTQALASAGALTGMGGGGNAVCPGNVLYGLAPASEDVVDVSAFQPVLRAVKTRLIHVSVSRAPRSAGVGGRTRLEAGAMTGIAPFGRYDGLRAARGGVAVMLVRGRRAPVRGVSLEHATLDLTGVEGARVGDEVIVLGTQGEEEITLAEIAAWQGVSPVDVLMTLDRRVPYRYLGGQAADALPPKLVLSARP